MVANSIPMAASGHRTFSHTHSLAAKVKWLEIRLRDRAQTSRHPPEKILENHKFSDLPKFSLFTRARSGHNTDKRKNKIPPSGSRAVTFLALYLTAKHTFSITHTRAPTAEGRISGRIFLSSCPDGAGGFEESSFLSTSAWYVRTSPERLGLETLPRTRR